MKNQMKRSIMALALTLASASALHADPGSPLWLRHQQISPDGKTIAFCYQGDIFTIPVSGGLAKRITAYPGYDGSPIWSPDSKFIAFSSDRAGSEDLYIVDAKGGAPQRLTFNSGAENPVAFLNDSTILFNAAGMPDVKFDEFPYSGFGQIYSIPTKGGRPELFCSLPMQQLSVKDGNILYTDHKGYEDPWRKHEKASISRDVWLRNADGKSYKKLTDFVGEDRNAVWSPDGRGFFYLSEKDGCSNIYYRATVDANGNNDKQITHYTKNPVRFLSVGKDGTICYGYDGEIYTTNIDGGEPKKVSLSIVTDNTVPEVVYTNLRNDITSFALSPNNKEVAFVMHGEVYVGNIEFGTVKRITNTPQQERSVTFSPDGRKLVYASERNGNWNLYMSEIVRKEDPLFCYATEIKETRLTNEKEFPCFQPVFSPDGKSIAFLRDRTEICGLDLKSKKITTIRDKKYGYSYQDGDQSFSWSPDSKWIIANYIGIGGWNNQDCALFKADGTGEPIDLTESGYSEGDGRFVLGGKAVLFASDRAGYRSHGSWGAQQDLYIMFLDEKAYDDFKLSKEQRELNKEIADKKKEAEKADSKGKKKDKKEKAKKEEQKEIAFQLDGRDRRTMRLTRISGFIGDAIMNNDGTKLYYIAQYEDNADLWVKDLVDQSTKKLVPGVGFGSLELDKDGNTVYLGYSGGVKKIGADGSVKATDFSAPFEWNAAKEREYIFNHAWKQVENKFYDKNLHGVDWNYYKKVYEKFLPYINNDRDFAEMLSEMLGELNASHTGARGYSSNTAQPTGWLGAFFDPSYKGKGLKVQEILKGGPLAKADSKIKPGMIILSIDGNEIETGKAVSPLLNGKVGKEVVLSVQDEKGGKPFEQKVKPISYGVQHELLFDRWIEQREEMVKKWSNGKIGYVYVREMNSPSFRTVFKDLLGKYRNCDAVVVDTRFNGGGWLHEDLAILLGGKKYMTFDPRGRYIGSDPFMQWNKPSCILMNEGNYSNGSGVPYIYKFLKLGKLIGAPVPGTMTAVWWERQINPAIVFGIPQVTCSDINGKPLENMQVEPDILIYNTPEDYLSGNDAQLKRAVDEMMKETGNQI